MTKQQASAETKLDTGFFDDPLEGWGNDDLLLEQSRREFVEEQHPVAFRVLDWPEFRSMFWLRDRVANRSRKITRRVGLIIVCVGLLGLILQALSPLVPKTLFWITNTDVAISVSAAILTLVAGVIGFSIVLTGNQKKAWLVNRFWTERLRQFYFQFLINNLDLAAEAMKSDESLVEYRQKRKLAFQSFQSEFMQPVSEEMDNMVSDIAAVNPWLSQEWAETSGTLKQSKEIDELISVLHLQRILIQKRYVSSKMADRFTSPEWRLKLVKALSDGFTAAILIFALIGGVMTLYFGTTSTDAINLVLFSSAVLGATIIALRAISEGLQLNADAERYSWYLAAVRSLDERFSQTKGWRKKVDMLREMEHLSYQELRRFTLSIQASRFII